MFAFGDEFYTLTGRHKNRSKNINKYPELNPKNMHPDEFFFICWDMYNVPCLYGLGNPIIANEGAISLPWGGKNA